MTARCQKGGMIWVFFPSFLDRSLRRSSLLDEIKFKRRRSDAERTARLGFDFLVPSRKLQGLPNIESWCVFFKRCRVNGT